MKGGRRKGHEEITLANNQSLLLQNLPCNHHLHKVASLLCTEKRQVVAAGHSAWAEGPVVTAHLSSLLPSGHHFVLLVQHYHLLVQGPQLLDQLENLVSCSYYHLLSNQQHLHGQNQYKKKQEQTLYYRFTDRHNKNHILPYPLFSNTAISADTHSYLVPKAMTV